jgi:transposase InsO family protein
MGIRANVSAGVFLVASMRNCRGLALEMALSQRQVPVGLIHHSDRGRQYWSHVYVERLLEVGANISMSAPGKPTDNAFAESFAEDREI